MTDLLESLRSALAERYSLERELGHGGMASVYLAHDVKHHRPVAIKVLSREVAEVLGASVIISVHQFDRAGQITCPSAESPSAAWTPSNHHRAMCCFGMKMSAGLEF